MEKNCLHCGTYIISPHGGVHAKEVTVAQWFEWEITWRLQTQSYSSRLTWPTSRVVMACGMAGGVGAERLCSLHVSMQTSAPNQQTERKREREKIERKGLTQLLIPNTCPDHEKWCWVLLTENTFASALCVIEGRLAGGAGCGLQNASK